MSVCDASLRFHWQFIIATSSVVDITITVRMSSTHPQGQSKDNRVKSSVQTQPRNTVVKWYMVYIPTNPLVWQSGKVQPP